MSWIGIVVYLLLPLIVLAFHRKRVAAKGTFLFFGTLVSLGFASLFRPLVFLPMLLSENDIGALIAAIAVPTLYVLAVVLALSLLIKRFYRKPETA